MSSWGPPGSSDPNPPADAQNPAGYGRYPGQPAYGPQGGSYGPPSGPPGYGPPSGPPGYGPPGQFGGYQGPAMPPPNYDGHPGAATNRASMGSRFGGLVVDAILIGIVSTIIGRLIGLNATRSTSSCSDGVCQSHFSFGTGFLLLELAIGCAYSAYFVGIRQQSLGHRVAGIKVVKVDDGGPIGPAQGALRWLVMSITGAILTLGYWSPFFDRQRRRGWHDKASGAMAVKAR